MADNGPRPVPDMSAHLSLSDEFRELMRKKTTITILLGQLTSPSMTVVSNTCFILSNLSAECHKYQKIMWELGAVPMLRTLTQSRHEMIAMAASSTLKNLLLSPVKPSHMELRSPESPSCSIPSLHARKLKALKDDIKSTLSDSYDPIESPVESYARRSSSMGRTTNYLPGRMYTSFSGGNVDPHQVSRSNSHDSIGSTHSEPVAKLRQTNQNLSNLYLFGSPTVPQIYSAIFANEDRVGAELEINEEFEPYGREPNAQMKRSSSSMKGSSFVEVLDEDPEPTDYSQRYQERPIDDFPLTDKPEVVGNEDSVKLYMTEGTPLNYSLVSSLTDLREAALTCIDEEKKSIVAIIENQSQPMAAKSEQTEEKKVVKVSFKKPVPPPKPNLRNIQKKDVKCLPPTKEESAKAEEQEEEDNSKSNNESNDLCKETPLMYSRSSSLGSLSDCELKSDVCQSSVVSEFSRRQSEVVTPSELPDSPLDSPRPVSPKPISNCAKNENNVEVDVKKPDLNVTSDEMCHQNHNKTVNNMRDNVFEDRAITFATEDTPAVFSLSISLSSLDETSNFDEKETTIEEQNMSVVNGNEVSDAIKCNISLEVHDLNTELMNTSSEDDGDDELLAACISSAMKKSNDKLISYNSLTRTDSKKSTINSMPSKPISIARPKESTIDSSGPPMARSAPDGQSSSREKDSLKVFNSDKSGVNSLIDLSNSSRGSHTNRYTNVNTLNISSHQNQSHSDESDDEEILKKCIASGMRAYRNQKSAKNNSSPKTPKTTPNPSPSAVTNDNESKDINPDQTRRFFVEDTPNDLSHCHSSLSSLSIKSDEHLEDQKLLNEMITRGMSQTKNSKIPKAMPRTSKMKNNIKMKLITNLDDVDDQNTYTICHKNQLSSESLDKKLPIYDNIMVSSVMTNSSNVSDLDNIKPPSLMDNAMFSSTESFSYRQVAPIVIACDQVLIDNVKPPSLMEEISMSQSCASITSDISDMPLDSDANNERIARMASNCVQRINLMTYSADNSETDTLDRIFGSKNKTIKHKHLWSKHIDVELSDTEVSEDLPIDNPEVDNTLSHNDIDIQLENPSHTPHTLPLESPTICADIYSDFDEENRIIRRERELLLSGPRISPIGSEEHLIDEHSSVVSDESELDSRATYNVNSPRRARIVRPVIRKNKHHNDINILTNQLSLNRPPIASVRNKYTAKQTRTSALRADRSRSVDTHLSTHLDDESIQAMSRDQRPRHWSVNRQNGKQKQYNIDIPAESFSKSSFSIDHQDIHHSYRPQEICVDENLSAAKNRDRSLLYNFKSKLSSSLSSTNLRSSNASLSSNSSTGVTPSCASFSRKLEVQSRIASLWKRSKSSSSDKSHKKSNTDSDLSRSISARRSFGKSKNSNRDQSDQSSSLQRSSTYEKLPQNDREANDLDVSPDSDKYNNNFVDKRHSNQRTVDKNDKNNANCLSYSSKQHKLDVLAKNKINLSDSNNRLKNSSHISHHSSGLPKQSSKSRRTCLVTAV